MLRKVAQDIPVDYPNLKELIQNMFETNTASDGVGLAAPQIGKSIRVVIIDLDVLKEDFPEYEGFRHAFINAHIVEYDEESKKETMEEGCLSIPGLHERVTRPTRIHVRYLDEERGVVDKCTLCHDRVEQGELPQCVVNCVGMAKWFGDLDEGVDSFQGACGKTLGDFVQPYDPASDVYQLDDSGNGPAFVYILRNHTWQG